MKIHPAANHLGGILNQRVARTRQRLLLTGCPQFTPHFILADVVAEKPSQRRFSEFSGDLSGRFLGALSVFSGRADDVLLARLAREILKRQRSDGRFGDPDLAFSGPSVDQTHMPLLWGNGRLLVGLLEYHERSHDAAVLQAAIRLGDFLLSVSGLCQNRQTAESLKSLGAFGFICFTQCTEGLALLGDKTGDARYLKGAEKIAQWVLPRGRQHSHGYLTTLRGMMLLHRATGEAHLLQAVEKLFSEVVESADYLTMGGVPEYFGWKENPLNQDAAIAQHSTHESRDEGCSVADFLRLGLQLWQATGKISYLEMAEHCLLNHLLFNQFSNGDFGHRHFTSDGCKPHAQPARAWWCCTMHGLRAFKDVQDAAVISSNNESRVNLYLDCDHANSDTGLKVRFRNHYDHATRRHGCLGIVMQAANKPTTLAFRQPSWAGTDAIRLNGKRMKPASRGGYRLIKRSWKKGDAVAIERSYRFRFVSEQNQPVSLKTLASSTRALTVAVFYGPWLLAIHDEDEPLFFGEPSGENAIIPPATAEEWENAWHQRGADDAAGRLALRYVHEGFPEEQSVSLRPLGHDTRSDQKTVQFFLKFKGAPARALPTDYSVRSPTRA